MRTVSLVYVDNGTPLSERMADLAFQVMGEVNHPNEGNGVGSYSVDTALGLKLDIPSILIVESKPLPNTTAREVTILRAYMNVPSVQFMKEKYLQALNGTLPENDSNTGSSNGGEGGGILSPGFLDLPVPKFIFAALTVFLGYRAIRHKDYASGALSIMSAINFYNK